MDFNEMPISENDQNVAIKPPPKIGVVVDCQRLRVRRRARMDAPTLCMITLLSEVEILGGWKDTDEFYKVRTETGEEGFCKKTYIAVRE